MIYEILDANGAFANRIEASESFVEQQHPGKWRVASLQDAPVDPPPAPLHISVGAFFDRFGALKWAILADASPAVQAVIKDASVRKHIDLGRFDLPAGLQVLVSAGYAIDPVEIINGEIQPGELP